MRHSNELIDPSSLERIVPDEVTSGESTGSETLRLHLERYRFACENLLPGSVLDIACGVGYGTQMLGSISGVIKATGVDLSSAAVKYATQKYASDRVSFACQDATQFNPILKYENIVSLETIEHVNHPQSFFAHLASLLSPGGRLIASVPVTPSVDANPHHMTNFSVHSFRKMGSEHSLACITSMQQIQSFNPLAIVLRKEARSVNLRRNLASFYLSNPSHLALRLWSTLRDGFVNKYLTIVWQCLK
jgi:2-polyprenyl-3-methyl-5-hydroxy-6-metoxy-1,4-benzoquinol methylase